MRISEIDILLVPSAAPMDPGHWMRRWHKSLSTSELVEPPASGEAFDAWIAQLVETARARERPALIIAHGRGASAVAHAAKHLVGEGVMGAILVSPHAPDRAPDRAPDQAGDAAGADVLAEPPDELMAFPALVIASQSNPHTPIDRARALATAWGAEFVDAGDAGHIDDASGHGPWPEGLMRLGWFLKRIDSIKTH